MGVQSAGEVWSTIALLFVGGLTGALFVQLNYKITLFRRRYSLPAYIINAKCIFHVKSAVCTAEAKLSLLTTAERKWIVAET